MLFKKPSVINLIQGNKQKIQTECHDKIKSPNRLETWEPWQDIREPLMQAKLDKETLLLPLSQTNHLLQRSKTRYKNLLKT